MKRSENMCVFFVAQKCSIPIYSYRIGDMHHSVFHGEAKHPQAKKRWKESQYKSFCEIPAASNSYREKLHVVRSGRYVPDVFFPISSFVVSEKVFKKLKNIDGVLGEEVVFDKLVDVEMPDIGDMSSYEEGHPNYRSFDYIYESGKNCPILFESIGKYYEILPAIPRDIKIIYPEAGVVGLEFGRYSQVGNDECSNVCKEIVKKYPFYFSDVLVIRQDAFMVIAPYLDLDYFAIDVIPFSDLPGTQ